jgi:hypothetical protein
MAELIRARHEVFGVQDVPDTDFYRDNGWTPVDEGTPTTAEQRSLYDPSANKVTDVTAYLETADDAERARVIDAEKAGQNRATIVNWTPSSGSGTTTGATTTSSTPTEPVTQ